MNQLDSDKYHANYISHLKSLDASSFDSASATADFDYVRQIKETKQYFIDSNYGSNTTNHREPPCDTYDCSSDKNTDKNGQQVHDGYVNDYDDSQSMNGDNSKDLLVTSSGAGGNRSDTDGGVKRKHFDDIIVDSDNNDIHKMYKSGCGDAGTVPAAAGMGPNKFDYMKGFDGIRPRSFEEIQSDEHHRLVAVSSGGGGVGGGGAGDYRVNSSDEQVGNRCNEDSTANISVSYASSDDLNQTNASEHDDKNLSGSDDEGGGEFFDLL